MVGNEVGFSALAGSGLCYGERQQQHQASFFPQFGILVPEEETLRTESLRATSGKILKPRYLCHYADIPEAEKQSGLSPTAKEAWVQTSRKMLSKEGGAEL